WIEPCAPHCGLLAPCEDARLQKVQVRLKVWTPSPPHAPQETPQCRKRHCKGLLLGKRAGKARSLPASQGQSKRRLVRGGWRNATAHRRSFRLLRGKSLLAA